MSGIRVNEWLHNSGTGGIWQTSAGNVGIASSVPTAKLVVTGDANVSGVATAAAFIPSGGQLSNRNLIINGAMQVAQRGTSSTGNYYQTLDRWSIGQSGLDEAPTQAQVSLTSSDTGPWAKGFRKALQVTNGNQTSGAGAADILQILYKMEAQDIANSGWDYTSASSYITYSFWIKSSIAQTFNGKFVTVDGTGQNYHFQTGSLSANTWTYVTKTIPGNSNITVNDDTGEGFRIYLYPFAGTDNTESITLNQWSTNTTCGPDMTSTWYTTNDSTFAITGVQLEVGSVATPFEHRSYQDELTRCQRYLWKFGGVTTANIFNGIKNSTTVARFTGTWPVQMRVAPTVTFNNLSVDSEVNSSYKSVTSVLGVAANRDYGGRVQLVHASSSGAKGDPVVLYPTDTAGYIQGDAEL